MTNRFLCGRSVHPIGFRAMPLSWPGMLGHRDLAIETLHAVLDSGSGHIDTSNVYAPSWEHPGHNESLVAEVLESLAGLRSDGLIAEIGLSNVSSEQLAFATTIAPTAAVQNEYSPVQCAPGGTGLAVGASAQRCPDPWEYTTRNDPVAPRHADTAASGGMTAGAGIDPSVGITPA